MTNSGSSKKHTRPVFIFDIGGVVIIWPNNDPVFKYVANRYGVPFTRMRDLMNALLPDLERNRISYEDFLEKSLSPLGKHVSASDDPARMITVPFERGIKLRKGVIALIRRLREQGYEVDGFSNTNVAHVGAMKENGLTTDLFEHFYSSSEIGLMKPDVEAFLTVLRRIGVEPADAVFIDNSQRNVLGARKAGIVNSIRFHSIECLKKDISDALKHY